MANYYWMSESGCTEFPIRTTTGEPESYGSHIRWVRWKWTGPIDESWQHFMPRDAQGNLYLMFSPGPEWQEETIIEDDSRPGARIPGPETLRQFIWPAGPPTEPDEEEFAHV
jgi:hypothetical protein